MSGSELGRRAATATAEGGAAASAEKPPPAIGGCICMGNSDCSCWCERERASAKAHELVEEKVVSASPSRPRSSETWMCSMSASGAGEWRRAES